MAEWQENYTKYKAFTKEGPYPDREKNPDAVVDALLGALAPAVRGTFEKHLALDARGDVPPLNKHHLQIPEPKLTWEQACALVIEAFTQFDPAFGQKAAAALADTGRIHVEAAPEGKGGGGYVMPAGARGRQRAELHMQLEGTINDAVYLAHELGHLLANDSALEAGFPPEKSSVTHNIAEVQGMFAQNIFYDYLSKHENPALRKAGALHQAGEVTRGLYRLASEYGAAVEELTPEKYRARMEQTLGPKWESFPPVSMAKAYSYLKEEGTSYVHTHGAAGVIAAGLYADAGNRHAVFEKIMPLGGDSRMTEVFEAAGITTNAALGGFFKKAVAQAAKPVEDIHAQQSGGISPAVKTRAVAP